MMRSDLVTLLALLNDRDRAVIADVERFRLLTTRQIQRLHFDRVHPTGVAAARACNRTLARLREHGVLRPLQRRVGGVRAGSAGYAWYLGPAGERALEAINPGDRRGRRRNYREPSRHFVDHTLAIAELAVGAIEADQLGDFELLTLETEPTSWQTSLNRFGAVQTLKPDLRIITASVEYEHHWFLELDMATEHLPVIIRQCLAYQAHRATGRYESEHGVYPAVVWVVPNEQRRGQLARGIATENQLDKALFTIVTTDEAAGLLRSGTPDGIALSTPTNKQPDRQEGGNPS